MKMLVEGDVWLAIDGGVARPLEPFAALREPATLVWEPAAALVGVMALEGDSKHSAIMIERRLRKDGSIDGDTKVFVHHIAHIGGTYQALYSTASLTEWQRLQGWVDGQVHACPWIMLTRAVCAVAAKGQKVVWQTRGGLQFVEISSVGVRHANAVFIGEGADARNIAAAALGQQVRALFQGPGGAVDARSDVEWITVAARTTDAEAADLLRAFEGEVGLPVVSRDQRCKTDGGELRTGVPRLAERPRLATLLNSRNEKIYLAGAGVQPYAAVVALVLAVVCTGLAVQQWRNSTALALQAREAADLTAQLREKATGFIEQQPTAIQQRQLDFIEALVAVEGSIDVAAVMASLKAAAGPELRMLSVRVDEPATKQAGKSQTVVVDGAIVERVGGDDGAALSSFVRHLASDGFAAEALDTRSTAAGNAASGRLFSYRLRPVAHAQAGPT